MRKLGLGVAGLAVVALLVGAGSAAASRGCPQSALRPQPAPRDIAHPPAHAVLACVGGTPITGARYAHWYAIYRHALKHADRTDLRSSTMATLIVYASIETEARQHHVVVTARDVRRSYDHLVRTHFRRKGSLRRSLAAHGLDKADLRVQLREQLLAAALARHESAGEQAGFDARSKARTTCARAFADRDLCGRFAPFAAGPPAFGLPLGPEAIAIDPSSDAVYVATAKGLTIFDGTTCNAATTSGCTHPRTVVLAHAEPRGIAIDAATHTLYVAAGDSNSILVLDATACNATRGRCDRGTTVALGSKVVPDQPILDPATHTLYVRNEGRFVSVIDTRTCNAIDRSGCGKRPARLATADAFPEAIAVNPATGTLYVVNHDTKTVSIVDAHRCSALDASGCATRWPATAFAWSPLLVAVDPSTGTLYVPSDDEKVNVIDGATCNAAVMTGCKQREVVGVHDGPPRAIAIDAPTHTAYLATRDIDGAWLLDTAACNASEHGGCGRTPRLARTGDAPIDVAVDERTRTVYVINAEEDSVSLIRADRCNASTTAGC